MRFLKIFPVVLLLFFTVLLSAEAEGEGGYDDNDADGRTVTRPRVQGSSIAHRVVNEMNLARTQPAAYARKVEKYLGYMSGRLLRVPGQIAIRTREGASAYREAIRFLKRVSPVPALTLSPAMSKAALDHCRDQGRTGRTGHYGSDGSSPFQRMRRYGRYLRTAGENISYGPSSAERIVVQLIVDDGVPSRGHRKNIFNPAFRVAGVGTGRHPRYRNMCVVNYAGGFRAN